LLEAQSEPYLTDFGLAKSIKGDSTLTHTNIGTSPFVSESPATFPKKTSYSQ